MHSNNKDLLIIRPVIAHALMNIHDRSKAYDTVGEVLGISRHTAKKLCFAYLYDATDETLRKQMIESEQESKSEVAVYRSGSSLPILDKVNGRVVSRNGELQILSSGKIVFSGSSSDFYAIVK